MADPKRLTSNGDGSLLLDGRSVPLVPLRPEEFVLTGHLSEEDVDREVRDTAKERSADAYYFDGTFHDFGVGGRTTKGFAVFYRLPSGAPKS